MAEMGAGRPVRRLFWQAKGNGGQKEEGEETQIFRR